MMHQEYPVLENKCSLSGMDDFSRNGVDGDLRGGGGWDLLMLSLRPLPVAVESSMKSAATMASNTNIAPNRNGAPENWNGILEQKNMINICLNSNI